MTVFFTDSLMAQIERGEVWYWSDENQFVEPDATDEYLITTGANPCSVIFEIQAADTFQFIVLEDPTTAVAGFTKTLYNMRRDSAASISTTLEVANSFSGGTQIAAVLSLKGELPTNSPFSKEVGLVLKPNEEYIYQFKNYSGRKSPLSYNVFLREL